MTNEEKLDRIQQIAHYASKKEALGALWEILGICKEGKHENSNVGGSDPVDDSAWGS